jgi:glycosyltransferase involved in cell wall biosynthesis
VIGTVAAMNRPKGKGQEFLIEAAQIVQGRYPGARYLLVGDGPIKGYLENIARKLGVADKIVFAGYQENVEEYIAAMDIFCFLSWDREGFGQVMVEAQAMGKPVIGTDIGGIPETFRDGVSGFLIRPQDSESLAQNIIVLLDDQEKRAAMSKEAVAFATGNFNLAAMVDNVMAVYSEMF